MTPAHDCIVDDLNTHQFVFQLNNPTLVEGLVLINVDSCAEGWIDWAASKVSVNAIMNVENTPHSLQHRALT